MRMPSNRQLNSAISDDKIKTEHIAEITISPENTNRQDFNQNFSNINLANEINFQNQSISVGQNLKTVRVVKSPSNRLMPENKLSLPLRVQNATADQNSKHRPKKEDGRHTKSGNIAEVKNMSKRVILTHATGHKTMSPRSSDEKTIVIGVQNNDKKKEENDNFDH